MDSLFLDKLSKVVFADNETVKTGNDLIAVIKDSSVHANNPFHEETLFEHLLKAGKYAHEYAVGKGWINDNDNDDDDIAWLYFVAGFLHDVGKPGAQRPLFGSKTTNSMSLKGHAICGAAMMDSWLLNESFLSEFGLTTREAGMIATVTNFHMCVYTKEKHHLNLLKKAVGDLDTARLLCAVRHGDSLAKAPPRHDDVDDEEVFEAAMLSNFGECCDVFRPNNLGLLINVTGSSGCGKSTIARQTIKFLKEKYDLELGKDVFWLNRDDIVLSVVAAEAPHLNEREAFEYYQQNKNRLSPRVSAKINAGLSEVLSAGERVCILDTAALMNCKARKDILKNVPKDTVTVDLWMHRRPTNSVTSDMDVIGSDVVWGLLTSVMEDRDPAAAAAAATTKSMYVLPIGHDRYLMRDRYVALLGRLMDERLCRLQHQKLPPLLNGGGGDDQDDTRDTSLHKIVSDLVASDESLERFRRFFKSHSYTVTTKEFGHKKCLVCIKYIDKRNKIMSHKWAREARGMGFVIDVSVAGSPVVRIVKRALERCVEVLSFDHHLRNGIEESQDMKKTDEDLSFLNKEQREVVEIFNHHAEELLDEQEDWYITSKVDGCLLIVSVYNKKDDEQVYNYMAEAVKACSMWHVYDEDGVLYIPSSSGSIEIGPNTKTTLITAAAGALNATDLDPSDDPDWVWYEAHLGRDLMRAMTDYYPYNPRTMIMEMVCADRTTYDGLTEHREIAVAYPHSALYVLGCYDNTGVYTPVYRMDTIQSTTFREPRTVRINTPSDALNYMEKLSAYTTFNRQRASPLVYDFHPEGFILTRHDRNDGLLASCKLKTSIYYKVHSLSGILNKLYDSKTKLLKTVEDAAESGSLDEKDMATIAYIRSADTSACQTVEEEGESIIGVEYKTWQLEDIFPEVYRFLYVVDGHIREAVKAFCDEAMISIVEAIAKGFAAGVDYSKLPASVIARRDKVDIVKGGTDYECVCQCIISHPLFDDKWYKNEITGLFRWTFGINTLTHEQVYRMAQGILKTNKVWQKNETKEIQLPQEFVEMVVSSIG